MNMHRVLLSIVVAFSATGCSTMNGSHPLAVSDNVPAIIQAAACELSKYIRETPDFPTLDLAEWRVSLRFALRNDEISSVGITSVDLAIPISPVSVRLAINAGHDETVSNTRDLTFNYSIEELAALECIEVSVDLSELSLGNALRTLWEAVYYAGDPENVNNLVYTQQFVSRGTVGSRPSFSAPGAGVNGSLSTSDTDTNTYTLVITASPPLVSLIIPPL